MNVVLDTNILYKDPYFKNTDMQKLISLAKKRIINLYIPEVVWKEFKSQRIEEYKKSFSEYEKKINTLKNKTIIYSEKNILNQCINKFNESKDLLFKSISERLNDFKTKTNLNIIKNDFADLDSMWKLYFSGEKPFKNVKSRNDIPDCFIFLAVKKIESPLVIVGDNTLREALNKESIFTYASIDDFLKDKEKEIQIANVDREKIETENIESFLRNNVADITQKMKEMLENELDNAVIHDDYIRDDNHEGTIEGKPSIDKIELEISSLCNDGNDFFSFDFSCDFDTLIEYFIYIPDYFSLSEEDISSISTQEWNDHYYLAEEEISVHCTGKVSIQIHKQDEIFDMDDYEIYSDDISFDNIELFIY